MSIKRRLAFGDPHGGAKALDECLQNCNYDPSSDLLICLGDICDGRSEVYEIVEFLNGVENKICILGNHDDVFMDYLNKGVHVWAWLQGAEATARSYIRHAERDTLYINPDMGGYKTNLTRIDIPSSHIDFFNNMETYHVTEDNILFVHAGFNRHFDIDDPIMNSKQVLIWDRDLFMSALSYEAFAKQAHKERYTFKTCNKFKDIFIGHTSTMNWGNDYPMRAANIINMDTGAGFDGRLSIIDIDTKQIWQSRKLTEIYPHEKGR